MGNIDISDRTILSTTWEVLDKTPNGLFGCPAISLEKLYRALGTTYETLNPSSITSLLAEHSGELLGSNHKISLKSVRKGEKKDYWIVFQPTIAKVHPGSPTASSTVSARKPDTKRGSKIDSNASSWEDLGGGTTVELLPDLPGGSKNLSLRIAPRSAREKIFSVLGLRKEKYRNDHSSDKPSVESVIQGQEGDGIEIGSNDQGRQRDSASQHDPSSLGRSVHSKENAKGDWLKETHTWKDGRKKPERKGTEWSTIDAYDYTTEIGHSAEIDIDQKRERNQANVDKSERGKADRDLTPNAELKLDQQQVRTSSVAAEAEDEQEEESPEEAQPKVKTKFDFTDHNDISTNQRVSPELNGDYYDYQVMHGRHDEPLEDGAIGVEPKGEGSRRDNKDRKKDKYKHISKDERKNRSKDPESNSEINSISPADITSSEEDSKTKDGTRHKSLRGKEDRRNQKPHEDRKRSHKTRLRSSSDDERTSENPSDQYSSESEEHHEDYKVPKPPTPFFLKALEGLPFEPDISIINSLSWFRDRYHLILVELIVLLSIVYILQASGL
ncbi:hypothetical protein I203_101909 [Kwoniella mangroviensis CBS 8507]|uniref:uncharacterized protein n=1 Tax=Kwoniella mangroviensis CBS 8507 TaxID=1296122 RepID=UPI00080D5602|nr:uncharacterized protein I203_03105 [Kwoniella mangroviensis CBS 8507]OCF67411.1 hypothetical protein I203_03105 [Kwoniella mangroviensis CBS 8507]